MGTETAIAPSPHWTREVAECAAKHGAAEYLLPIWEMTRRLFPAPLQINVLVEDDPEIADLQFIVFEVKVRGWSVQELCDAHRQWHDALFQCYPGLQKASFVLGLESSDSCDPKTSSN